MSIKHPSQNQGQVTPWDIKEAALKILQFVLSDDPVTQMSISEARVYRSRRSRIWQATYTGPEGGQIWRSTGLTNKRQALLVAKRWEAAARLQRERMGRKAKMPIVRAGQGFGLSQEEIAVALKLSVRAVRAIEKRAVKKLLAHPELRQVWDQYLTGQLREDELTLTPGEIEALFGLVRAEQERLVLQGILDRIQP